jgi:hypothetical protein
VTRAALVVTPDLAELDRWAQWLEATGFLTVACAGPRLRAYCPRLEGGRCLLRDAVDVAVVAIPATRDKDTAPEASCTTSPDNGTTVFVDPTGILGASNGLLERSSPLSKQTLIEAVKRTLSLADDPAG